MDGVDDVALAPAADAWSRTYRSRAEAVNALASPVHLRSGSVLRAAPPDAPATRSYWTVACTLPVCWTTACR